MSQNSEKCPSQLPEAYGDIFKLLVLPDHKLYCRMYAKQRKSANLTFWETETRNCLTFLLNNYLIDD